jgi:hypothetical protein
MMRVVTGAELTEKCKIKEGEDCCAYLVCGAGGFQCAKDSSMASTIRKRLKEGRMIAKGEYCK